MKKSILIFVMLSVFASGLNYLVYPLFSRILAPTEYINITLALSLFTQISAFLSSILAITIGLTKDAGDNEVNEKLELLQAFLFRLFIVLASIFLVLSPFVMSALHTPTLFAVPIALMMLFSIPILIVSGYLNGKNEMIKLGLVALISASSQFTIGLFVALLTDNSLLTMLSMLVAQLITISVIYALFSQSKLPSIIKPLKMPLTQLRGKGLGSLLIYTAATSLAVMAISLIQVADLFIMQGLQGTDIKFYTDIYVISRVVFFAGMIFIWPFLGEISTNHHHSNRKPFIKLLGYFTGITMLAICAILFFGNTLISLLFGATYSTANIVSVGLLSITYKYLLLIITAVVLYFVVLRSYMAIWIAVFASVVTLILSFAFGGDSNINTVLLGLVMSMSILAAIGLILLLIVPIKKGRR